MKPSDHVDSHALAIVAIGCRYPGGIKDASSFWEVLSNGIDTVGPVPADRWDLKKYYDPRPKVPGKMYVREGAFLAEDIWNFDPGYFGVSPLEAERMDPQQRLLLKVVVEALESAHITKRELAGSKTGVYVGSFSLDNFVDMYSTEEKIRRISAQTPTSGVMTMLSARLSYYFGLSGACLSLDTACSSSLVAFHLACQALRAGEIEQAIVGGVNVMFRPEFTVTMCYGGFLAKDGRCKSFDASADGYGRGEGAGVVLIKPYAKALEDGNEVFAIICGTGVNQDGRTNGITVPNEVAQLELMRSVSARSGVLPNQIGYAEAHGTGTLVGDPKEAYSLGKFLSHGRDPGSAYYVGSVKTNIGHQEAGAGVAAIIKTALCLKYGRIVPNLHFNTPNPAIDFEGLRLRVPRQVMALELDYACVNSFGFGGTNAHAILRKPDVSSRATPKSVALAGPFFLPVSARSELALRSRAAQFADALTQHDCTDLLHTVGRHRDHENVRTAITCRDADDAREKLIAFAGGDATTDGLIGKVPLDARSDVTFVYTGMGPQFWGMGGRLLAEEPLFAEVIDELDDVFTKLCDFSLRRLLGDPESFGGEPGAPMSEPRFAQPANLAVQLALTAVYKARGLSPSHVVGHSVGEIAAACVAGSLSIRDAVTLSYHRGTLHQRLSGRGGMLAVGLRFADVSPYLEGRQVSVAALNSPTSLTLAGNSEDLDGIARTLEGLNIFAKRLRVKVPYHSVLMEETREDFFRLLHDMKPQAPSLPLYSTLTGGLITGAEQGCEYWWKNSRDAVRFYPALQALLDAGQRNFLEMGPHPVLRGSILEILRAASIGDGFCIEALNRSEQGRERIQRTLSELYMRGVDLDFNRIAPAGKKLSLPSYPWDEQRYAYLQDSDQNERLVRCSHPLLQEKRKLPGDAWRTELNPRYFPWLEDHKIQGQPILPGAAYVEAMLACGAALGKLEHSWAVRDVSLESMTPVEENAEFDVRVTGAAITIHGRGLATDDWERKATGRLIKAPLSASFSSLDLAAEIGKEDERIYTRDEIYSKVRAHGYGFGTKFQVIERFHVRGNTLYGLLDGQHLAEEVGDYLIHPVLLDGVFQVLNGVYVAELPASRNGQYLPSGVDEVRLFRKGITRCWVRCVVPETAGRAVSMDISIHDMEGAVIGEVHGYRSKVVSSGQQARGAQSSRRLYAPDWEEISWPDTNEEGSLGDTGTWLVFSDRQGIAAGILEADRQLTVPPDLAGNAQGLRAFLDRALVEQPIAGILFAWSLDSSANSSDLEVRTGTKDALALLPVLQALQQSKPQGYRKTVILTREAMPIPGRGSKNAGAGALVGLIRTANLESPELAATVVDLEEAPPARHRLRSFLVATFTEREVACRASGYLVPRLDHLESISVDSIPSASAHNYSLQLGTVGDVDSLHFLERERRALAPHEVEIEVRATALNFKDLMKVLGLLDAEYIASTYFGDTLGMECAGVIARVGSAVSHLNVGDAVIAGAADSFAKYVVVPGEFVFKKPSGLSFEQSVILFLNTMTAYYSLITKANLGPGDRVLIHSATGGVGLTAVQIAQMVGAEVYATAGNDAKRRYLRELGVKHVSDSRSLRFHDDILKWTGGQGVDVVLNFLPGELMEKSLELLSFGGRFVEIGKADVLANNALRLGHFQKNISYTHVDFDYITTHRPDICLDIMPKVVALYEAGELRPISTTVFPAARVADAFKYMMTSEHIGKLVLSMSDTQGLYVKPVGKPLPIRDDGAYLLTGGFSELGLLGAEWLAAQGARHLCLIGRSGATTDEARAQIEKLRDSGVRVDEVRADISREGAIRAFVQDLNTKIRGVMHLATVYRDAPLHQQTEEGLRMVLGVKALGAQVLIEALPGNDLDWFVSFSSVSAFGNPSQANYSAANCYLDYLAQGQAASGRSTCRMLSINWGVVRAGEITRNPRLLRHFEQAGVVPLATEAIYPLLDAAARAPFSQVAVLDIDWERFLRQSGLSKSLLFKRQTTALEQGAGGDLLARYLDAAPEQQPILLEDLIIKHVAAVLRVPRENLTPETRMDEVGVDSLMAVTLSHSIEVETSVELGSVRFLQRPTVRKLASEMAILLLARAQKRRAAADLPRSEDWVFLARPDNARARLICFPGAGMTARDFSRFAEIPGPVELVGVRYPGGVERPDEAPDSLPLLGQALANALSLLPPTNLPVVLFGHSFGGLVAYETACAMQEKSMAFDQLMLAASSTPHAREIFDAAEIARAVSSLQLDAGVGQGRYMDNFKRLLSGYLVRPSERPPIQVPVVLVLARKDEFFNNDKLARWEDFATSCEKYEVDVGHFLLSHERVHAIIGQAVSVLPPNGDRVAP